MIAIGRGSTFVGTLAGYLYGDTTWGVIAVSRTNVDPSTGSPMVWLTAVGAKPLGKPWIVVPQARIAEALDRQTLRRTSAPTHCNHKIRFKDLCARDQELANAKIATFKSMTSEIERAFEQGDPSRTINEILRRHRLNVTEARALVAHWLYFGLTEQALYPRSADCGQVSLKQMVLTGEDVEAPSGARQSTEEALEGQAGTTMLGHRKISSSDMLLIAETTFLFYSVGWTFRMLWALCHWRLGLADDNGRPIPGVPQIGFEAFKKSIGRFFTRAFLTARHRGERYVQLVEARRNSQGPSWITAFGRFAGIDGTMIKRRIFNPLSKDPNEETDLWICIVVERLTSMILGFAFKFGKEDSDLYKRAVLSCLDTEKAELCRRFGVDATPEAVPGYGIPMLLMGDSALRDGKAVEAAFPMIKTISLAPLGRPEMNGTVEATHKRGGRVNVLGITGIGIPEDAPTIKLRDAIKEALVHIVRHNLTCDVSERMPWSFRVEGVAPTPAAFAARMVRDGLSLMETPSIDSILGESFPMQTATIKGDGLHYKSTRFTSEDSDFQALVYGAAYSGPIEVDSYADPVLVAKRLVRLPNGRIVSCWLDHGAATDDMSQQTQRILDEVAAKQNAQKRAAHHAAMPEYFAQAMQKINEPKPGQASRRRAAGARTNGKANHDAASA